LSALPNLTGGDTKIDGATQTAFTGDSNPAGPEIVINGALAPPNLGCFRISSPNNTINGLVINGFPGPGGDGIRVLGITAQNNVVTGCYIGVDATGSTAVPNGGNGISTIGGANSTRIGGAFPAERNVISGNERNGINIIGTPLSTAGNNVIQGNLIGTDASAAADLGNAFNGISIIGTNDNLIGGTAPGAGNVSSGNGQNGIRIAGLIFDTDPDPDVDVLAVNASTGSVIQGNRFGTDGAGTAAIPNGVDGVRLNFAAQNNLVGGSTPEARNICSGNVAHGVHLDGVRGNNIPLTPVSNNTIQGNFIGADATGAAPLGNQLPGVILFFGPVDNLIGGSGPGQGNVIAFNTGSQIPDGQGGFISVPGAGVSVSFDPNFNDPGNPPNIPGIANDPVVRNRISGNSIHSNTGILVNDGLGIDLNGSGNESDATDGVNPNDAGDGDVGANNRQNYPVLESVSSSGGTTTIEGTFNSTPNTTFTLEFFSNSECDPSGFGEGETFLGSAVVSTDASGDASFTVTFAVDVGCGSVTATATDPLGNTSEFSNCLNQAPVVSCGVAISQLWPPNHNLINVGLAASASDNCPNPTVSVEVFSDEDDETPTGDGNHSPDAKDIGAGTLRLRAERKGDGDGRVYLIIVTATDSSGNTSRCCSAVTVAHSQSKAAKQSVASQAAAAIAHCEEFGAPPPGFVVVGDGLIIGPKQ
jgi:hypothetical protein